MLVNLHTSLLNIKSEAESNLLAEKINLLGIEHIRFAVRSRDFIDHKNQVNRDLANRIHHFLDKIKGQCTPLLYLYGPKDEDQNDYFYGGTLLQTNWEVFIDLITKEFANKVFLYEVWNEQNVSWSYLCKETESGLRPWSGNEFVNDIFLPASNIIKSAHPNNRVILGAFADDGMTGHTDREPPLSGQIGKTHPLRERFHTEGLHTNFYIIPNFLEEVVCELKDQNEAIDGVALHPYPYFGAEKGANLAEATIKKIQHARGVLNENSLEDKPLWITEFGARELDLMDNHYFIDNNQALYLTNVLKFLDNNKDTINVEKIFWYTFRDSLRDYDQEKPFGILDINSAEKEIFWTILFQNFLENNKSRIYLAECNNNYAAKVLESLNHDSNFFSFFLPISDGIVASLGRNLGSSIRFLPVDQTGYERFFLSIENVGRPNFKLKINFSEAPAEQDQSNNILDLFILKIKDSELSIYAKDEITYLRRFKRGWESLQIFLKNDEIHLTVKVGRRIYSTTYCGPKRIYTADFTAANQRPVIKVKSIGFSRKKWLEVKPPNNRMFDQLISKVWDLKDSIRFKAWYWLRKLRDKINITPRSKL